MGIKVILMDIGGVVFLNTATEKEFRAMAEIFGKIIGVESEILEMVRKDHLQDALIGTFSNQDYFKEIQGRSGKKLPDNVEDIWIETASKGLVVNHCLLEWVACLRKTRKVFVFSTISSLRYCLDMKLGIYDLFDGRFLSTEMGITKADPAFYTNAIAELGIKPDEALLIDDQEKNINSAKGLGIHAFKYEEGYYHSPDLFVQAMADYDL